MNTIQKKLVSIKPGAKLGNTLHICWMLHNLCNNRCSYCSENNFSGSDRWLVFGQVVDFMEKVFAHYKKDLYHVSFTGGEPTLWKEFERLCNFLKDRKCEIGLTSNGTRRLDFWEKVQDNFNWLCLSYHPEYTRDEEFLEVVKFMANRTRLSARIMMHPEDDLWDRSLAMAEKLRKLTDVWNLFVEYVPLQEEFGNESRPYPYKPSQQEFFSRQSFFEVKGRPDLHEAYAGRWPEVWDFHSHFDDGSVEFCRPNDLVSRQQVNFLNWNCHAGRDLLFINHEGYVFRGGCKQGGPIGHIFDEVITFPESAIVCRKDFCPCGTDILVHKTAPAVLSARPAITPAP